MAAKPYGERALAIFEKVLGPVHPNTKKVANNLAFLLTKLGATDESKALQHKFGLGDDPAA